MNYYGAHLSTSKGIINALDYIKSINGNMIQIFISNPRSKKGVNISKYENQSDDIKDYLKDNNLKLVIHSPYTINLGKKTSDNLDLKIMMDELYISDKIGSLGCVFHVGKYTTMTELDGIENMYDNIVYLIEYIKINKLKTYLILETAAGQGTELLYELDKFIRFYNLFTKEHKKYFKICIDTCHIFSSGLDLNDKKIVDEFIKMIETKIKIKNVALIHLNDSKRECNSRVDRHENLYEGEIGTNLNRIIKFGLKHNIPIILETPNEDKYKFEIDNIRKLE